MSARIVGASAATIGEAAQILRDGGTVAFPTETVYGLGADATQDNAVARVFAAKGRPAFNPLIVHVADRADVATLADTHRPFDVLARSFWPGPLTVVLPRKSGAGVSRLVSAGGDTLALRCPGNPIAHDLLKAVGRPLAAPSANRSGSLSPTTAGHVAASLGDAVDLIIDGGECAVGLELTVIDLTRDPPAILRPGAITREQLMKAIGEVVTANDDPQAPKSPGQQLRHYAPGLPLRLNAPAPRAGEAFLGFGAMVGENPSASLNLSAGSDLAEAAQHLFAMLRALDDPARFKSIAVAPIPEHGVGVAINDRLRRAAHRSD